MKALITGATGFVGSRVARHFVARGHSVSALIRDGSSLDQLGDAVHAVRLHVADGTPESIRHAIAAEKPDVVLHLATYYVFDHHPEDLKPMVEANILFPLMVIDAMTREGVGRLVNTGSAWQHFQDAAYSPVCLHSATKQAFESLVSFFVETGRLRCITLMLNDTYGPGDPRRKIFTVLREWNGEGKALAMSAGEQMIDIVHVDDVARAFEVAAERLVSDTMTERWEEYSVSSGQPLRLRELVEKFLAAAGLSVAIDWGARPYREREVMVPWTKGRRLPGWQPSIGIDEGLMTLSCR
jgi:nucleoside-diphosphate-sugar epimerase